MRFSRLVTTLAAVALLLGATACGSDDDDDTAADAVAEVGDETESSVDEATGDGEDVDDADGGDLGLDDEGMANLFCMEASLLYSDVRTTLDTGGGVEQVLVDLEALEESAPEEIQDDIEVLRDGLAGSDDVEEFVGSEEFVEADENITGLIEERCGE